jgi:hypothetical protein
VWRKLGVSNPFVRGAVSYTKRAFFFWRYWANYKAISSAGFTYLVTSGVYVTIRSVTDTDARTDWMYFVLNCGCGFTHMQCVKHGVCNISLWF